MSSFLQIFICPVLVFAYDDDTTHPALTNEIIIFYNLLNPNNTISPEEKNWIISGSIAEDEWPRWINHFYDPVRKIGWNGEGISGVSPEAVKLMANISVTSEEPLASTVWLNSEVAQKKHSRYGGNQTWQAGLVGYARNNKEEGFKILGHILHLLEDASVPDHTRNDTHAHLEVFGDDGSPYEDYLSRWNQDSISSLQISNNLIISGMHPPTFSSPEEFIYKLAEYSNNYFFSKDTIDSEVYKNPKIEKENNDTAFGLDENNKVFPILRVKLSKKNDLAFNKEYSLNKYRVDILDAYFSRLSQKEVLYGAGMIDLFLRKAEEEKINQEFKNSVLAYDFSFLEIPSFSLVGELARLKTGFSSFLGSSLELVKSSSDFLASLFSEKEVLPENKEKILLVEQKPFLEKLDTRANLEEEETPIIETEEVPQFNTKTKQLMVLDEEEPKQEVKEQKSQSTNSASAPSKTKIDYRARFTEFFYDAEGSDVGKEWLEIQNYGTESIPLGTLNLLEEGTKHTIKVFSGGELLGVGKFLVIADDPEKFLLNNPSFSGLLADSSFSLSNSSETLALIADGENIDSQTYSSSTGASGDGNSLQRKVDGTWVAKTPTPGIATDELVNGLPEIIWSFPSSVLVGEKATFTAASSSDPDGDKLLYFWDFGDNNSATGMIVERSYSESGSYEVNLSISDSKGATSRASGTISIGSIGGGAANHLVISEIQVSGVDSGDEFIEIYNPTESAISLNGWSIQYVSGSSELVFPVKKNFTSSSTIQAKSFFLIAKGLSANNDDGYRGVSDLTHRSFSLSGASSGGIIILAATTTPISSLADQSIIDLVSYGLPNLLTSDLPVPDSGQSLERNSFVKNSCFPAINDYEFSGNSCDSKDFKDFTIRAVSKPQNSLNLPEPRLPPNTPSVGSSGLVTYLKDSLLFDLIWGTSSGSTNYYEIYRDGDLVATTTNNEISLNTSEIGKEITFKVRALDIEGLGSNFIEEKEMIPSFLSRVDFFLDKYRGVYVLRGFYDGNFLVPQIKRGSDRPTWSAPVFFLNKEPVYSDSIEIYDGQITSPTSLGGEALKFNLKRCNGADITGNGVTFPDSGSVCPSFGYDSGDTNPNSDEDKYFEFTIEPRSDLVNLDSNNFLTVAFYELYSASTYGKYMVLTAIDKTHYKFEESLPSFAPPELYGDLLGNLDFGEQKLSINFNRASDRDDPDSNLIYQLRYSSSTLNENDQWKNFVPSWVGNVGNSYIATRWKENKNIELRTKDSRDNLSSLLILNWSYPALSALLEQNINDSWSSVFGFASDRNLPQVPDKAIFQSFIVPTGDSFNRVNIRLKNSPIDNYYGGNPRLTVFRGTSTPDFSNALGETISGVMPTGEEKEIIFTFSNPINVEKNIKYWLVLDVDGSYRDNVLQVAVANNNPYSDGEAGEGYFKGPLTDCGCSLNQTNSDQDWYFQLYTIP